MRESGICKNVEMTENEALFKALKLGAITIPHRIIMAPLTRGRASKRVPNELMAEYYSQRACAGLIISEATAISEQGYGWNGSPGIYNDEQVAGWRKVTNAVHKAGGRMFLQLWHMGRISHSDFQNGNQPVGPSAIKADGDTPTPLGKKAYEVPRALEIGEIPGIVEQYAAATRRAREAGFDGVEVHSANGYLIDQFLRNFSNQRTDEYGGSIENRARFMIEVVEAVIKTWSADRTGIRFSPTMNYKGMGDSDPVSLYTHVAQMLNKYDLAYVHTAEAIKPGRLFNPDMPRVTPHFREVYKGVLISNGSYDKQSAIEAVQNGDADAIAFGQPFLANPDLPWRVRDDAPLNEPDVATYYTSGSEGYTDYPAIAQ